jgi:hypothetical protein
MAGASQSLNLCYPKSAFCDYAADVEIAQAARYCPIEIRGCSFPSLADKSNIFLSKFNLLAHQELSIIVI